MLINLSVHNIDIPFRFIQKQWFVPLKLFFNFEKLKEVGLIVGYVTDRLQIKQFVLSWYPVIQVEIELFKTSVDEIAHKDPEEKRENSTSFCFEWLNFSVKVKQYLMPKKILVFELFEEILFH